MAATTRISTTSSIATEILDQVVQVDVESLSVANAREFLQIGFKPATRERVRALVSRSQDGRLSPDEQQELDEVLHVADLVAILHSKARQVLKAASRTG